MRPSIRPPPERERRPGQGAAHLENNSSAAAYSRLQGVEQPRQPGARDIAERFRVEERERDLRWIAETLEDEVKDEVSWLISELEDKEARPSLEGLRRRLDEIESVLLDLVPLLRGIVREIAP